MAHEQNINIIVDYNKFKSFVENTPFYECNNKEVDVHLMMKKIVTKPSHEFISVQQKY